MCAAGRFESDDIGGPTVSGFSVRKLSRCLAVCALLGHASVPSAAAPPDERGGTGTIRGRVTWAGSSLPAVEDLVAKSRAERDPQVCARERAIADDSLVIEPRSRGIRNAVAYLVDLKGAGPRGMTAHVAGGARVVVDQKNCAFIPRVTAMHQDQELVFTSSDRIYHNIHLSALTNGIFNQVMAPEGRLSVRLVAERRAIPLNCGLHPWMHGSVLVFDHPFFAKSGDDGSFEIARVPAGTRNLVVWHERAGYLTEGISRGMAVTVVAGKISDVGEVRFIPGSVP